MRSKVCVADFLRAINRFTEPDETGPLCDLLWSDPHEDFDRVRPISRLPNVQNIGTASFLHNDTRGCSYVYTFKVCLLEAIVTKFQAACEFLDRNGFLSIIRAHEAQDVGYKMYKVECHFTCLSVAQPAHFFPGSHYYFLCAKLFGCLSKQGLLK